MVTGRRLVYSRGPRPNQEVGRLLEEGASFVP